MTDFHRSPGHPFRRQMAQVHSGRSTWITWPFMAAFVALMGMALMWFVFLPAQGQLMSDHVIRALQKIDPAAGN